MNQRFCNSRAKVIALPTAAPPAVLSRMHQHAAPSSRALQTRCEPLQQRIVVGRPVTARRPVQPQVDKPRPSAGRRRFVEQHRIGQHATDLEARQQRLGHRHEPAAMPRLQCHGTGVPLPHIGEKPANHGSIESEARRQLHDQAPEPVAQPHDLRQKFIEGRHRAGQPLLVRDGLRQLDREAKSAGCARGPALVGLALVRPIERGIDLHRIEALRIALEVRALGGKRRPQVTGQAPTRAPDARHSGNDLRHPRIVSRSPVQPQGIVKVLPLVNDLIASCTPSL
ncbi:hypothetical protein J2W30_000485 [Variovorax boronicumulans]|nr:hypothetical protein [Variovorax boronicumulans]MDQ0609414.1 hypothetical protein [Variovorax sp. W1I1]